MNDIKPIAPARLEDVAARVGISRSEVSRVLNGRVRAGKGVGAATRERILQVAREMNYRPNRAAQNLARGRTDTVALMMVISGQSDPSPMSHALSHQDSAAELSPHYHEIIGGLTYTLSQYGLSLLLAQMGGPDVDPIAAMEQLARSRTCDGMIITDMQVDDRRPQILRDAGLPFVVRGSSPTADNLAVGMDNVAVGFEAIKYLSGLGHKRILFFNLRRDLMAGQRRYDGALSAAKELNVAKTVEFRDDAHTGDDVYAAVLQRMRNAKPPTAIFAEDEIAALGVERALAELGLRVPDDVSVMTCLNARFMRLVSPTRTVLNVRQHEVAALAADLLARMLHGEALEHRQHFLSPILEERGSTAPPKGV
jgi:DNA-binding LacI/PurR family transcriptional regulator